MAFIPGGDGGEAMEGRLHCKRRGVSQLLHTGKSRLPRCHQKGVSESGQAGIFFKCVRGVLNRILQP